jgi:hypothetical protein
MEEKGEQAVEEEGEPAVTMATDPRLGMEQEMAHTWVRADVAGGVVGVPCSS